MIRNATQSNQYYAREKEAAMGWWNDIWKSRAEDWTFVELNADQLPDGVTPTDISSEAYIDIRLRSMRIVNVQKGFTKFYGVVHSFVSVPYMTGEEAKFNKVISPNQLKQLDAKDVDRVIVVDQLLAGPVPYRGGNIDLEIGLFSVPSSDLAGPYIELLTTMADKAGISFVTVARPFVEPLMAGIKLLTGASKAELEIGLARQNPLRTGWWAVIRANKDEVNAADLKVTPDDYRLVKKDDSPIHDYPYMIFSVNATNERKEFFMIPSLVDSYKTLTDNVRDGKFPDAKRSLSVFKLAVLTCPDLIYSDATKIVAMVEKRTNDIMSATQVGTAKRELPELKDFQIYGEQEGDQ
jgi:hypothetical protein